MLTPLFFFKKIQEQANHFVLFTVLKLTDFCGSGVLVMLLLALMNDMGKRMFPSHLLVFSYMKTGSFLRVCGFFFVEKRPKLIQHHVGQSPKCPFTFTAQPSLMYLGCTYVMPARL